MSTSGFNEEKKAAISEQAEGIFQHYYLPAFKSLFSSRNKFPYKLRINICNEDYTDENRKAISRVLCGLINKYFVNNENILTEFKYFILSKEEVDKSDFRKKIDFWKAIKQNKKAEAQKIIASITDEETRVRYQGYFSEQHTQKNIDDRIAEQEKVLNAHYRMVGKAQFTLYLDIINFNTSMGGLRSGLFNEPVPHIDLFSHPINLLKFLRELDTELKRLKIRPGNIDETDSRISSFFSFRQEQLNSTTGYVAHSDDKKSLAKLKKAQEDFVLFKFIKGCLNPPNSYKEIWDNGGTESVDKIVAILNDYTKGNSGFMSNLSLFLSGHVFFGMGRHHVNDVRSLVKKIENEKLDVPKILEELRNIISSKRNVNFSGSLFRRVVFINEMCIEHTKKIESTVLKL